MPVAPMGMVAFVYTAGYWLAVALLLATIALTIIVLGYLAYRARVARDLYAADLRRMAGRDPRSEADVLVAEFASLRADVLLEWRAGQERLEGVRRALQHGLKG